MRRCINVPRTTEQARQLLEKLKSYEQQDGCIRLTNNEIAETFQMSLWYVTNALKVAEDKGWLSRKIKYVDGQLGLKRSITINWSALEK